MSRYDEWFEKDVDKDRCEKQLREDTKHVTEGDFDKVLNLEDEIRDKFESKGPLRKFINDVGTLFSMVRDYWTGAYREIPYGAISAIVAALLYVFYPFDLIPDILPGIGYVDDAVVVRICINMVRQDLDLYRQWKGMRE